MNIYKLHSEPESLDHFEKATETNPDVFWEKYKNKPEELKKREKYIAKSADFSFYYAVDILSAPFPAGEEAIAKSAGYAYDYAADALKGPFPAGEAAIAKDEYFASLYAKNVLKKDFYLNGKLIAKYEP